MAHRTSATATIEPIKSDYFIAENFADIRKTYYFAWK
jgi:hypothetical protein